MLDDDEVLVATEETGYRLCSASTRGAVTPVDGSRAAESIFSATFDCNNPNRMFICYQDGTLKLFDTDSHRLEAYQIIFKKSTSAYDLTPTDAANEKVITTHWDKVVSIPNRPDELIFLLGISRNLMYTALPPPVDAPYSSPPFLRKSSRGDIPGFFYGAPIMEISVHKARVTSLSVNPSGSLLASGDESGRIRVILLRLFDQLSSRTAITSSNQSSRTSSSRMVVTERKPSFSIIFTAHCDGPVFSLEWLPIELPPQGDDCSSSYLPARHALASGSMDRSVRVWTISCSPKSGISVEPAFILDTLSTHILTMTSLLHVDTAVRAKILAVDELLRTRNTLSTSDRSTASPSPSRASPAAVSRASPTASSPPRDIASVDRTMRLDKANSVYLACGTNAGTLYIWRMDFEALRQSLLVRAATTGGQKQLSYTASDFIRDSTSMLYSLLQASDRPLIHVSMAAGWRGGSVGTGPGTLLTSLTAASSSDHSSPAEGMMDAFPTEGGGGHVLLVCSDTQGVARIYCSDVIGADLPSSYSETDSDVPPLLNLALHEQYRSVMSHVDARDLNLHPLIKVGEQSYQNAVVACRFQQAVPVRGDRQEGPLTDGNGSPDCVSIVPSRGLVKSLMVALAKGEVFMYDASDWTRFAARLQLKIPSTDAFSVIRKALSPNTPVDDAPSPSSSGSDEEQHHHHLHDDLIRSRASPKLQGRISFSNSIISGTPPPPSHYSRIPIGASVSFDDDNGQSLGVQQGNTSKGASGSSRINTADEEEVSEAIMMLPRALPPPAPTPPMGSSNIPGDEARRQVAASAGRKTSVSKAKNNSTMRDQSAVHPSTGSHPSTGAHPSTGSHPSTGAHQSTGFHPSTGAHPSTGTNPSTGTHPSTGTLPSTGTHPSAGTHPATSAPDSSNHSAYYRNDFGMPSMTHSKVLEQKLRNITSQLAHDEV